MRRRFRTLGRRAGQTMSVGGWFRAEGPSGPGAPLLLPGGTQSRRVPAELLARAHAATSEVSLITDAGQNILHAGPRFEAITGYSEADVLGRNCRLLQGPGTDPEVLVALRTALAAGEDFRGEILNYRKDGSPFWNSLTITPLRNWAGTITHFVSVQRDISTRMALHEQLRFQAMHDLVTGLPNRVALEQHFADRMTWGVSTAGMSAIGMIDLDDFRTVNNDLGHEAGDVLLRELGRRLQAQLRRGDFLARLGGDEFILVVGDLHPERAAEELEGVLQRLHLAVEEPFRIEGTRTSIGMSMGLALFPAGGADPEGLLRQADEALYRAKAHKQSRSRWWELAPQVRVNGEVDTKAAHGDATAYRSRLFSGGLVMHVQPVIDLRNGELHLVEALARLQLPDGSVVHPGDFLPLLSDADVDRLFREGLDQALGLLAGWDAQGIHLDISVNIAPSTLLDPDCPNWVSSALDRHRIQPQRLGLELLESQTIEWDAQRRSIEQLVALGVGMAMDDLGSGYSSLHRLSVLPFNAIKFDRELMAGAASKPVETLSLIATLTQMGRDLGVHVVVEGLENTGMMEAAAVLGTRFGQGYFLARPMPAAEVPGWVSAFRFPLQTGTLHTCMGALAYHWQFTRFGSPHPRDVDSCPVTAFLAGYGEAGEAARRWHEQQHGNAGESPASSRLLIDWLVQQIRTAPEDLQLQR
jgi:diguanylate cyclase (GGDEF)-like protein/PAS domain S-box-containing protein